MLYRFDFVHFIVLRGPSPPRAAPPDQRAPVLHPLRQRTLPHRRSTDRDPSHICDKSKHNENIKFYSKRPLVNVCYPCVVQFHNEPPRRITYSEIHVQNINYLPTIQYSIRDCKIRQIIALVANRDSRYCGSAIGSRRTAICGINNLIIRNTEFTIRSVVPFVCFVFNMSIWFSYYCRIGQRWSGRFSPNETIASARRIRFILIERWVFGSDLFKLHVLICRWIKHVCTFQYREHPCYTRDLANHSLLSKRLHRTDDRRLYCATIIMFIEYFISSLHVELFNQWYVHCYEK